MYLLIAIALFTRGDRLSATLGANVCYRYGGCALVWVSVYLISFRCFELGIRMLRRRISYCRPPTGVPNAHVIDSAPSARWNLTAAANITLLHVYGIDNIISHIHSDNIFK